MNYNMIIPFTWSSINNMSLGVYITPVKFYLIYFKLHLEEN